MNISTSITDMGVVIQKSYLYSFISNVVTSFKFETELKWKSILILGFMHFYGACWSYHYAGSAKWQTFVFAYCVHVMGGQGITCGVHRLWTHKSYKATTPLRVLLMIWFASTAQNTIYDWVRDHRVHHKFSDTPADPHNVNRGFWFSHIGWLLMKKNKHVIEKGKQIDMSDIENDPVAMFDRRHHGKLAIFFGFILPTLVPILLWSEEWKRAVAWLCFIKFLTVLHSEMTVNSVAHMFGYKPYDKDIEPVQSVFVSTITIGEGWHNFHHTFPSDYRAAETFDLLNWSTMSINLWATVGLAYDLKETNPRLIEAVIRNHGKGIGNAVK